MLYRDAHGGLSPSKRKTRNPRGIGARRSDERAYETALRLAYFNPFVRRMQRGLAQAAAANQAYRAMDDVVAKMAARPQQGIPVELIRGELRRMEGWHRARVISSFRAALGVDVRPFLTSPAVNAFMTQKVGENVDLIKTIPGRFRDGLKAKLEKELREAPFDQERLTKLLREEYQSSGYNLRRIVRDQTSKTVNQLSELRQGQLGIEEFVWRDSADERVRPECDADGGNTYRWSEGSPQDGAKPGTRVLCRCYAEAVILPSKLQAWGGRKLAA